MGIAATEEAQIEGGLAEPGKAGEAEEPHEVHAAGREERGRPNGAVPGIPVEDSAGAAVAYTILGPWDSDHERGVISYLSPFARLLMSKKPGDRAELDGQPHTVRDITPGL